MKFYMYLASTKIFPKFPIPARREREGEVFPLYKLTKDFGTGLLLGRMAEVVERPTHTPKVVCSSPGGN